MKVLTLDDETAPLRILNRAVREAVPEAELRSFSLASEAVREIEQHGFRPDIAFLDIKMPGMTGLELAARIKSCSPLTRLVFVTGFSQYALDAFAVRAGGYLLKPVAAEQIRAEFAQLDVPYQPAAMPEALLRVQCFGNFEVFCAGVPLEFSRRKAKELFAYLIHRRGAECATRELAAVLFEDAPYSRTQQSYLQTLIVALSRTLAACGAQAVLVRRFGVLAVNTALLDCDYYRFLTLDPAAVNAFAGEYMEQYDWGTFTVESLNSKKRAL